MFSEEQIIEVESNNDYFLSIEGIFFDKTKETLIQYPIVKIQTTYTIPDNTTTISEGAFQYSTLQSITITDTITEIQSNSFSDNTNLEEVKFIYDKEPKCGIDVFRNTPLLDKIKVPKNYESSSFCQHEISKELLVGKIGEFDVKRIQVLQFD